MSVLNQISKCVAFVTGGASGLGAATVKRLANSGAKVAVFDLPSTEEHFNTIKNELDTSAQENCIFSAGDVTDEQSIKAALLKTIDKFGHLNLNVNCAGIGYAQRLYSKRSRRVHSDIDFERVLNVNVGGTYRVMTRCVEVMASASVATAGSDSGNPIAAQQRGVIINTASIAAFEGQIGQVAYSASKGAIASMTLPAARDLSDLQIRVMTIAPGIIETPLLRGLPEKAVQQLIANTVYPKRLGLAEEYAHLVQCIYENSLLNGSVIRLDGAMRMQP